MDKGQQLMKTKNMTIQHFGKSIDQSPLRLVFFFISLVLVCLVLSPAARDVDKMERWVRRITATRLRVLWRFIT